MCLTHALHQHKSISIPIFHTESFVDYIFSATKSEREETKMMNVFALCLVLSSIVSGGFFSPPPQHEKTNQRGEDLIVKEANRVIMVEYEREARSSDLNNHSPPSPPTPPAPKSSQEPSALEGRFWSERSVASGAIDSTKQKLSTEGSMASSAMDSTKQKFKEAASVLPNIGQGLSADSETNGNYFNAKELICDAYGKCKHKLSGIFGKAKDRVEETGETITEKGKEGLSKVKDTVGGKSQEIEEAGETAMGKTKEGLVKVKDKWKEAGKKVINKKKEALRMAGDKGMEAGEMAREGLGKAKESVYETGEMAKEGLGKAKERVYETGEEAMGKTKEGLGKVEDFVLEKAEQVKQKGREVGEKTMENVKNIGQDLKKGQDAVFDHRTVHDKASGLFHEGGMNFSSIFQRGTDVLKDAARHSVSKQVLNPAMGVLYLLGLATAYGISVWVTFVSSHVLAGALPRQQFGIVQSKIYPVYFRALLGSIGSALLAHALRNPILGLKTYQAYNMMACLGLVLFNLLYFEPRATKVMYDKMKLEKEEGRGTTAEEVGVEVLEPRSVSTVGTTTPGGTTTTATSTSITTEPGTATPVSARREEVPEEVSSRLGALNGKLKKLNAVSSFLNVLTLMALTSQLVYLGRGLPVA